MEVSHSTILLNLLLMVSRSNLSVQDHRQVVHLALVTQYNQLTKYLRRRLQVISILSDYPLKGASSLPLLRLLPLSLERPLILALDPEGRPSLLLLLLYQQRLGSP